MKETGESSQLQTRLAQFFNSCKSKGMSSFEVERMCLPIYLRFLKQEFGTFFKLAVVAGFIGLLITFVPVLNWTFCAIGRLILIHMLPYWKWTDLYKRDCLWNNPLSDYGTKPSHSPSFHQIDCSICENYDSIRQIDFPESPEDNGLQPMIFPIVVDKDSNDIEDIIATLFHAYRPCALTTNLLFARKSALGELLKKAEKSTSYFYHFRFCNEEAVKKSRLIDGRPDFYSAHLPPAYSSWILLSRNYSTQRMLPLVMDGLVFVRQVQGPTKYKLTIRTDCDDVCPNELTISLQEGQGLMFSTELWDLSYSANTPNGTLSLSFITETDLK